MPPENILLLLRASKVPTVLPVIGRRPRIPVFPVPARHSRERRAYSVKCGDVFGGNGIPLTVSMSVGLTVIGFGWSRLTAAPDSCRRTAASSIQDNGGSGVGAFGAVPANGLNTSPSTAANSWAHVGGQGSAPVGVQSERERLRVKDARGSPQRQLGGNVVLYSAVRARRDARLCQPILDGRCPVDERRSRRRCWCRRRCRSMWGREALCARRGVRPVGSAVG